MMAEPQEEIIIIEDSDAASFSEHDETIEQESDGEAKKRRLILIIGAAIALILIILIVVLLIFKLKEKPEVASMDIIEEKLDSNKTRPIEPSKLENMIAKANYLYSNGSKEKALGLYEKIAEYSEAISEYNLGVAQLKDEQYDLALATFARAIKNDEKRCVSAINAAVCALHLGDQKSYEYYIDLATAYLPFEQASPLYSYYHTLINYYRGNYLEALTSLEHKSSDEYPDVQKTLSTRINALFDNNYKALESLDSSSDASNELSLGLLYARVGDLALASNYFEKAIDKNIEPLQANLALAYVNLKSGKSAAGAKILNELPDIYGEEVYKPYPLKVSLKESLFESDAAQKQYRYNIKKERSLLYAKIFYFSPYKIFNANSTISYIRKGNANIFIDDIASAQEYLKKSSSSSNVNRGIAQAIKMALSFQLRAANAELERLIQIQPKHSILHYNLALTYAQMGNMPKAHEHFLRSYYLDAKNYLSGIYALMTAQLINTENQKMKAILKDAISSEEPSEEIDLYKTILAISENNTISVRDWLDNHYAQRPLYLALSTIIALSSNDYSHAKSAAAKLTQMLPNDILPHLMYIDSAFAQLDTKEYASAVMNYFKDQNLNFNDLYYGPFISRHLYVQQNLITGKLFFLRKQLREVMQRRAGSKEEIVAALALASLYDRAYEESYTLYNHLIDDLKVNDAQTLFLAGVASIAAGHHENAIALFELSKIKNTNFLESRYALGLLYLESNNYKGGAIQLARVGDEGFISDYFTFDIDKEKLLFEKRESQK